MAATFNPPCGMPVSSSNHHTAVDDEWLQFLVQKRLLQDDVNRATSADDEAQLLDEDSGVRLGEKRKFSYARLPKLIPDHVPPPNSSELFVSTKSKIAYLTEHVDLDLVFWAIPVLPYESPQNGVIKKQIKMKFDKKEQLLAVEEKLAQEPHYEQHIIHHIDNPGGRIKFKDVRKVSVGISKKDIVCQRSKKKKAFQNCFVIIMRIRMNDLFREFHIKVFNTGKLEIPGLQSEHMFGVVMAEMVRVLQPFYENTLSYSDTSDTVLMNSNFKCNFNLNREILYDILRYKYNIPAIYDPCSYPGIQCKICFNKSTHSVDVQMDANDDNATELSFMIFRTGSVLIVGKCDKHVLTSVYSYLKTVLLNEFPFICQTPIPTLLAMAAEKKTIQWIKKKKTIRKKYMFIN